MFPIFFGWCYSFSTIKSNSPFFGWRMNNVLDFNFNIFFTLIVNIYYYRYVAWARVSGPSSDCGSSGQAQVTTEDQIQFYFKSSKKSNNGTDVNAGQLPQLLYKLVRFFSNFHWYYFVFKIVLTYCEKKLFEWLRKTFESWLKAENWQNFWND